MAWANFILAPPLFAKKIRASSSFSIPGHFLPICLSLFKNLSRDFIKKKYLTNTSELIDDIHQNDVKIIYSTYYDVVKNTIKNTKTTNKFKNVRSKKRTIKKTYNL